MSGAALCAGNSIKIGEETIIGAGAVIMDNDFHMMGKDGVWIDDVRSNSRPIVIGKGCFIGARAIVLKGVTIGDHAAVGAGAVVTRDVPAGSSVGGNPARVLSSRERASEPEQ